MTNDALLQELADRLALRQIVDAYAHGADRRQGEAMAELFTEDGLLAIHDGDLATTPTRERRGRDKIASAMKGLDRYLATTHFVGQQIVTFDGDQAQGETYCLAHHLREEDGQRYDYVMSIRYLDTFVRHDDHWLISERHLVLDWTDDRRMGSA